FGLVCEEQRPHAVVVARGGEGEHGGHLDREPRLRIGAPEMQRSRLVHDEEQGQLALLHVRLDERVSHARRDVPTDRAEAVALLVGPDFGELDPLAAEDRPVFAGEEGVDEVARPQLDPLHLLEHVGGHGPPARAHRRPHLFAALWPPVRHGTPTASRILAITRSVSMSSASASNVSSTRWRSTSKAIAFTSSGTTNARPRRYACARAAWAR